MTSRTSGDGPACACGHADRRRGWRIAVTGTGGQGVLTAARWLCDCFVEHGHDVVSGQLHGMAQRGGAVRSEVIIDGGVSPVIAAGRADFVVGFEPVEAARALPLMSGRTIVFLNTTPVIPYVLAQRTVLNQDGAAYPDMDQLVSALRVVTVNVITLDATQRAVSAGSVKALNMVMLGCLLGTGRLPLSASAFLDSVAKKSPKGFRETNVKAFRMGVEAVRVSERPGSQAR